MINVAQAENRDRAKLLRGHPRREHELVESVAESVEHVVPDAGARGPLDTGSAVVWPNGGRIEVENLVLRDGRRVQKIGDLPFCPACGCNLEQKITDGEYAVVNFDSIPG